MKLVDCFIFYNELDLLYYRLSTLYDVVDYFVIVESTKTHAGNIKKLYFQENINLFEKFTDKIIHIITDELNECNDALLNEIIHRNSISIGIEKINLDSNDLIMISDLDEIPDRETLKDIKINGLENNIMYFEQDLYYYNLNCRHRDKWTYSVILYLECYKLRFNSKPQSARGFGDSGIKNGGWHLSYFGNSEFIRNKLREFSHQEYNNENYTDLKKIEKKIKNNENLFSDTENPFEKISIIRNTYLPYEYEKYLSDYIIQDSVQSIWNYI